MKLSRKIIALLLTLVLLVFAGGCGQKTASDNSNTDNTAKKAETKRLSGTLKLGFLYAQSGNVAKISGVYAKAVKLAVEDVNKSGILEDAKIELVEEDEGDAVATSINAFQKLITTAKVPVILGPDISALGMAAIPLAQKAEVLALPLISSAQITTLGDMVFTMMTLYDVGIPAALEQVVKAKNIKNVAILTQKDFPSSATNTKVRLETFNKLGVNVVLDEQGLGNDKDFSSVITKIQTQKPDLVIVDGTAPFEALFLKQYKNSGYKAPFMAGLSGISTSMKTNKEAYEGEINFVTYLSGAPGASAEAADLDKRLKEATGMTVDQFMMDRYDSVWILANAVKKAGTVTDSKAIRDALATIEYEGVRGKTKFTENRTKTELTPILVTAKNGVLVPFEQ